MKAFRRTRGPDRRRLALALAATLVVAACGGDGDDGDAADTAAQTEEAATGGGAETAEETGGEATEPPAETATGGGEETGGGGEASGDTTLIATLPQEPASWNYWEVGANALRVPTFYNVQETLVEVKPDGSIVPMLAEDWTISDDGLTYTFTIRAAKFHDGSDLDSADVVYSMKKNAESPLSKLSAPHVNVTSVTAVDATTVEIVLSHPSRAVAA